MEGASAYLNQLWNSNHSPIFEHGKIAINGRIDSLAISEHTLALRNGTAAIKGGFGDDIWQLQRNNVAVQIHRPDKMPRVGDETDVPQDIDIEVVDAANGFGDSKHRTQATMNAMISAGFIVGTDKMVPGQQTAVPLILGGLRTIMNTGDQQILPNMTIAVSAPDPDRPQPYGPRQDMPVDKVLWWTVPFSADKTVASVKEAYRILTQHTSDAERRSYAETFPNLMQFIVSLEQHIRATAYSTIYAAAETGLVRPSETLAEVAAARDAFMDNKARFAYTLGRNILRLDETSSNDDSLWSTIDQTSATGFPEITPDVLVGEGGRNLPDTIMHRVFARTEESVIIKSDVPGLPKTSIDRRINDAQRENLTRMVASIRSSDRMNRCRILGRALSKASPGQFFNIHLGNNTIGK